MKSSVPEMDMDSEADQALLQQNEEELMFRDNRQPEKGMRINLKHLKSFEILKSSVKIFVSNTKLMILMILSAVPFFAYMVFYEIEIQDLMDALSELLVQPSPPHASDYLFEDYVYHDENDQRREHFRILLHLVPLYLIFCPLLELSSLLITVSIAAKTYAGENQVLSIRETVYEVFCQKKKLMRPLITSVYVQFLSNCALFGLFWPIANHYFITTGDFFVLPRNFCISILSTSFHSVVFVVLLYKFLDWSALWNMGIVISIFEEENGMTAIGKSADYGKHCRQTGLELMLVFFAYSLVLRLPFLVAAVYESSIGLMGTAIVIWLVCLGNLVKWVAVILYYYDCKAQTLLKKVDEEHGESGEVDR